MKKPKHKLVIVEWLDAWVSEDADERIGYPQTSVGFLVEKTSRIVRIAQSWNADEGYLDFLNVPTPYVRSVRRTGA